MRATQLIAALRSDLKGVALIEFAIVAPVLAVMLIGVVDLSMYISANLTVQRAARAGSEYAVMNGYNSAAVSTAVTASTARRSSYMSAISATPSPVKWCGCPGATTGVATAVCGTKCTSGLNAGSYVTANATATFTPLFPWPGFSSSRTISSASTVRID